MREPKNQMLGTMEPPPLMQLSVNYDQLLFCNHMNQVVLEPFHWCYTAVSDRQTFFLK